MLTVILPVAIPIPRAGRLEVQLGVIDAAGHGRHRAVAGVAEVARLSPHCTETGISHQIGYVDEFVSGNPSMSCVHKTHTNTTHAQQTTITSKHIAGNSVLMSTT